MTALLESGWAREGDNDGIMDGHWDGHWDGNMGREGGEVGDTGEAKNGRWQRDKGSCDGPRRGVLLS